MKKIYTIIFAAFLTGGFAAHAQEADSVAVWREVPTERLEDWQSVGAVSKVDGKDLMGSYTTNIFNTLYGRLPGVTLQQGSGEPGSDTPSINGRGLGTWAGAGMLYVVDGFVSSQSFVERLAPAEIESIEFLKDAAATAIYGNRGANGVMLVNTRHGKVGGLKIELDIRGGYQMPVRLPQWLDSYGYASMYNEALANEGKAPLYSEEDLMLYRSGEDPYLHPNINWQQEILKKGTHVEVFTFTANGGNATVRYNLSFSGANNAGLLKNPAGVAELNKGEKISKMENFSRYNFRTNVDIRINKYLSAVVFIGGNIEDKATPGNSESAWNLINNSAMIAPNSFPVLIDNGRFGGNSSWSNPIGDMTQTGYISYNGRSAQAALRLNEKLDVITPGLSISGAISFNTTYKAYSNKNRSYARYEMLMDPSGEYAYNTYGQDTDLGGDESSSNHWRNLVAQVNLAYKRMFAGAHYVDTFVKYEYDEATQTGSSLPFKNMGVAFHGSYSYMKRYMLDLTVGGFANDNFPAKKRWGLFPAVGLGWNMHEEEWMKDNKVLNHLKLKASYGLVGNSDIGGNRYQHNQYYSWAGNYWFGASSSAVDTYIESVKANPNVTWEKDYKANVGLELAMLDSRLYFQGDVFFNHRTDLLATPYSSMPSWVGFSRPSLNIGVVDNHGFEAVIGWRETMHEFKWHAQASAWYAQNKVVYNSEAPQVYDYRLSTGRPVGQPFALEAIGFFRDQADIDNSPVQTFDKVVPGDIKYKDQNGDGVIDEDDYYPIGHGSRPLLTMGFDLGFNYKGFDLRAVFQAAMLRTVYIEGAQYHAFQNNGKISTFAQNRWTAQTADTADYPRLSTTGNQNNFKYSTFWQRNGDFLKLRNLEMGYTFSGAALQKARIEGIRLYVSGLNLFSLDHMKGYNDPETLYGYPAMRTVSFGLNIKF